MVLQLLVLIVAISPKASDSQSDPFGLAVRRDGLNFQRRYLDNWKE